MHATMRKEPSARQGEEERRRIFPVPDAFRFPKLISLTECHNAGVKGILSPPPLDISFYVLR